MLTGRIKNIFHSRGFGFISTLGRPDIFFNHRSLEDVTFDELVPGQVVRYEEGLDRSGRPRAESVCAIERSI